MEVLKNIKENYPDIPAITINWYASIETAVEATKLEVFHFVPKSLTPDEMKEVAMEVLAA